MIQKIEDLMKKRYLLKNDFKEFVDFLDRNYNMSYHRTFFNKRKIRTKKYNFRDYRKIIKVGHKNISRCQFYDFKYSNKPSFCLDTCIAMNMLYLLTNNSKMSEKINNNTTTLIDLAKTKKIQLYITHLPMVELYHLTKNKNINVVEILKSLNIQFITPANSATANKATRMGHYYCYAPDENKVDLYKELFNENINPHNKVSPIFKKKEDYAPLDAMIMATSAVAGLPLITENTKDFVWRDRQKIIALKNYAKKLSMFAIPMTTKQSLEYARGYSKFPALNTSFEVRELYNPREQYKNNNEQEMEK